MPTQVVVIHGGDPFETYQDYLTYLKNYRVESIDYFKRKDWKSSLQEKLGDNFDVIAPQMPNKKNARYLEWKIWFDKLIPFLNDGVILIGHSLGGIFLAKYLAENVFPKKISGVFLVAAPFDDSESDYPLVDFALPESLEKFSNQVLKIFIYASKDDKVVPFSDFEKYKRALPTATATVFKDRQHFGQLEFPELIKQIEVLSNK
ncbi:MAG: alpha/beta fold hydrolase [Candidatus Paceibacterota bacterium]|jgi:hypothetical protein